MLGIRLFHGRKDPSENLDDWGTDGPVLGPFDGVHSTYVTHIRPVVGGESDADIQIVEDMYYYDGVYYGDMVVITWDEAQRDFKGQIEEFSPEKAKL